MYEHHPKNELTPRLVNTPEVVEIEDAVIANIEKTRPERTARILDLAEEITEAQARYSTRLAQLEPGYQATAEDRERRNSGIAVAYSPKLGYRARFGTSEIQLSKGDILTAHLFGQRMELPSSAPIELRKQLLDTVHTQEVAELEDKKLAHEHTLDSSHHYLRRQAFEAVASREHETIDDLSPGLLAERMVFTWLSKLSLDGQLPFAIESVDVVQDVIGKMDFKITISGAENNHKLGVKVEAGDVREIGIQFTINTNQEAQDLKNKQIKNAEKENVDELVLMTVPAGAVTQTHKLWSNHENRDVDINSRDPRGPTELLSQDMKVDIITKLLDQVPEELKIAKKRIEKIARRDTDPRTSFVD